MKRKPPLPLPPLQQCRAHISSNGRLNIPANFRKAANLKDGEEVVLLLKDKIIQVQPFDAVICEAQELVAEYFAEEDLMADLKAMRASDAARDADRLGEEQ